MFIMALHYNETTARELFSSRGAQIYWQNWNKLKSWYMSYMLPEMTKWDVKINQESQVSEDSETGYPRKRRRRRRRQHCKNKATGRNLSSHSELKNDNVLAEDGSLDESVSAKFLEFSQKTLQHRLDLKKLREEKGCGDLIEYAADDEGPEEKPTPSADPPNVQAGSARTRELKLLYGSSALRIQSLETQLQAKFDENRTRLQPKLWPVIPLNL